ncbi:MAG TPA: YifB family Mg chelatase-like AAA ATPase [Candidatus Wallbacteria bacterium]|nr:YifB family Mg chelatase-like AAA ATPase [Candidatus Wallbacteria bacterium]
MLYKCLKSAIVLGIDAYPVDVEIDLSNGLPGLAIVGLPDTATTESKERVRSAIHNSGYEYPLKRITVNLAPAHLKKDRAFFDLAIAIGILLASGQISSTEAMSGYLIAGEISLNAKILPLNGILPIAALAREAGLKLIAPAANYNEIRMVEGLEFYVFDSLSDIVGYFSHGRYELKNEPSAATGTGNGTPCDFSDVAGQSFAKRALEIAAAGGHAIMMRGVPGSGKTMMASCLPGILPAMTFEESLEVSKIYSIAGMLSDSRLIEKRAFRSPHHSISEAAMIGGTSIPRPGEVSLAHNGVLFLDEFTQYKKTVIEALRQPLNDGAVTISRAYATYTYPARFMLVAASNPCPCGYLGDTRIRCVCSPSLLRSYRSRISGPIIDRIDIQIEIARVERRDMLREAGAESSAAVAERVMRARRIQQKRFSAPVAGDIAIYANGNMSQREVKRYCVLPLRVETILQNALEKFNLTMRSYYKILKVARTIADIAGKELIEKEDVCEAIQYRTGLN